MKLVWKRHPLSEVLEQFYRRQELAWEPHIEGTPTPRLACHESGSRQILFDLLPGTQPRDYTASLVAAGIRTPIPFRAPRHGSRIGEVSLPNDGELHIFCRSERVFRADFWADSIHPLPQADSWIDEVDERTIRRLARLFEDIPNWREICHTAPTGLARVAIYCLLGATLRMEDQQRAAEVLQAGSFLECLARSWPDLLVWLQVIKPTDAANVLLAVRRAGPPRFVLGS